jgi:ribokinase
MQKNRILVVGIFVVDLSFYSSKLPMSGETVIGRNYNIGPGGKGSNQCVAISRSGGEVSFIARIGNDDFGKMGIELYNNERISLDGLIISENDKTGSATIAIDDNGMNSIIVVPGASSGLTENMIDQKLNLFKNSSICLTGFELPLEVTKHTLNIAKANQLKTILNPAPYFDIDNEAYKLVDYLTPNEHEASSLTGIKIKTHDDAKVAGRKICELGVETSIITLGEKGVLCTRSIDDYEGLYIPALKQNDKVIDTVGAGDVFNGAFATAISNGIGTEDALFFANKAASISVTKPGAALSSPYKDEINKY